MEFLMEEEENRTEMDNGDSLSTDKNTNVTERKRSKNGGNKDGGHVCIMHYCIFDLVF